MQLVVGESYLRSELHSNFGGNPRAGICPTQSVVLIFSDPPSGTRFGYDQHDYVSGGIYSYTGEGRRGDQQLVRGNKALLSGKPLLLFSRIDAKSWVFVGEVGLADPEFEIEKAPDQSGVPRNVLVFRFVPLNARFELLRNSR